MADARRFPSLASIRAFEAAARLRSFTKAAQELDTTSASVSYHVRQLEKQIGVTLFRRHPHKVELTEAGELVATEAMNAFAALRASFIKAADLDESHLSVTTLPTIGTSWLTPRLGRFRAKHPDIQFELDLSAEAQDLTAGRFDAAIRNGHGRWPGLRTTQLLPSIFMPLCAPALKAAAATLSDPSSLLESGRTPSPRNRCGPDRGRDISRASQPLQVPLLGRKDWWQLWYRTLGFNEVPALDSIGTNLSAEYLDVTQALAGHGIAIASPILFKSEIDSGRLVPAHPLVASDGRSFWLTFPVVRQDSRKINQFREWLCDEAAAARNAAADFIRTAAPG